MNAPDLRRRVRSLLWTGGALAVLLIDEPGSWTAQAKAPLPAARRFVISRISSPIQVDGVLDEGGWATALTFDLPYEWSPGDNSAPPVQTEFLTAYDDHNLYAAWRCHDPDPSRIRAHYMDRDNVDTFTQDDHVLLMIDPFNDERRALQFRVNPLGVQVDATYSESDGTSDFSYDLIWDSAARFTSDGWTAEIAIPLNQIRFPGGAGHQTWGFDVERSYPRDVRHRVSAWPRDRDKSCLLCQVDKVAGFEHLEPGHALELDPTVTAGRSYEPNATGSLESQPVEVDPGLSLRWGITSALGLNAAINPDFSQVEADAAQLDVNTRFALFYPEKRPFFLENSDLFSTPIEAVYTRSIADPDWGLKLTGKGGRNALGLYVAQDTINNYLVPSNQFSDSVSVDERVTASALRYRRDVGRGSAIGVLYAAREADQYHNRVGGLDAYLRLSGADELRAQYLLSTSLYADDLPGCAAPGQVACHDNAWSVQYDHSGRNWRGRVAAKDLGPDFRADSGFVPRVDTKTTSAGLSRIFRGDSSDLFTQIELGGNVRRIEDHTGQLTDQKLELTATFEGTPQSVVEIFLRRDSEFFNGVLYEPLDRAQLYFSMEPGASVRISCFADIGNVVDYEEERRTHLREIVPTLQLKLGRHFDLRLEHDRQELDKPDGPPLVASLSQARVVVNFGARSFLRGIFQYLDEEQGDTLERGLFSQVLYAFKTNPRTVIFLGATEDRTDLPQHGLEPIERFFFLKLGYAWTP